MNASAALARTRIVVIGGTSGFGRRIASRGLAAGAAVTVVGRDRCKLDRVTAELSAQFGTEVRGAALDATLTDELTGFLGDLGTVDHLVSMVGGAMAGGFLSATSELIRATIEDKFYANLSIARAAAPHLRDGGSMVFTAGAGGRPHEAAGALVGNHAISMLVQGLAIELAPRVRANAVAPAWTPTGLWRDTPADDLERTRQDMARSIPLGRTADPDEVAQAYIFLMECGFITGQTIAVDGGVSLVG
ncbi:SDR family oxidoreductase [Gordonia sp. CPCC 206044]|uniref:SDR family oxidoreductase n=1 Tax=Gordonia sp. CPCC 206044 TaxID=3140793 RepID=UPI003AF3914A